MKNLSYFLIFFASLFLNYQASAQLWFEAGGRAMYGATALFESNITDDDEHTMNINTGLSYGALFNLNFSDRHGIAVEAMFANSEQSYEFDGITGSIDAGTNTIEWNSTDVYLMYRALSQGAYFEIGPKLSLVNGVDQNTNGFLLTDDAMDVSEFYTDQFLSGVIGFGMYIAGSRYFTVSLGFRVEYAFQNFTNDEGVDNNFPLPYDNDFMTDNLRNINAYGGIELKFPIGGIAKAQCGQRRFIFGGG